MPSLEDSIASFVTSDGETNFMGLWPVRQFDGNEEQRFIGWCCTFLDNRKNLWDTQPKPTPSEAVAEAINIYNTVNV